MSNISLAGGGSGSLVINTTPITGGVDGGVLYKNAGVLSQDTSGTLSLATVTSPGTELVLEQTGDSFGTTRLHLQNRGGSNGALFENTTLELVDFAFLTSTTKQANFRFENRGGNLLDPGDSASGEFQFLLDVGFGLAAYAAIGDVSFVLSGNQQIAFGPPSGGTFAGLRPSGNNVQSRLTDNSAYGSMEMLDIFTDNATFIHRTLIALTDSAAANIATLTNAPVAGNPTKWIAIDDNGTTRYMPVW